MQIYQDNGYLNMAGIINHKAPFIFLYGARGTGKTFGALEYVIKNRIPHIYMRRTQAQLDIINKYEFSPYKEPCKKLGLDFDSKPITKYNYGIYGYTTNEDGEYILDIDTAWGYTAALSTMSNIRGFSAEEIEIIIYDEFIPESHERPIKNEAEAFLNAYETINRNRELTGRAPLKCICMANSNNIACPLFIELELVEHALRLEETKQKFYYDPERGLMLMSIGDSPISEAKSATALYKLVGNDSKFRKMSILNDFNIAVKSPIRHPKINQLEPIITLGEIGIWQYKNPHKHLLHITFLKEPTLEKIAINDISKKFIRSQYAFLWDTYMQKLCTFENYMCEVLLQNLFL